MTLTTASMHGLVRGRRRIRRPAWILVMAMSLLSFNVDAQAPATPPPTAGSGAGMVLNADALRLLALSDASPEPSRAPSPQVLGHSFSLAFPLDQASPEVSSPAVWRYDASARTLELEFLASGALEGDGVLLDMMVRPGRRLPAGAVTNARELDAEFVALPPAFERIGKVASVRRRLPVRSFAEAAAIGSATIVEVQGYVAGYPGGAPNRCSLRRRQGSSKGYLVACAVALAVTHVRFITPNRAAF